MRVSIGEDLGLPPGTPVTGKLVAALRLLGFDYVFGKSSKICGLSYKSCSFEVTPSPLFFVRTISIRTSHNRPPPPPSLFPFSADVIAGADITIMEEGTELMHRLRDNLQGKPDAAPLPMFTSCCPGWIDFVEKCDPDLIPHLSTAKSPHMMEGALIKAFFSETLNRPDTDLDVVSIMPCVRKQGEADRAPFHTPSGAREVDHVLTTRDIADLIKRRGIDFASLPDAHFDDFLGMGSGAGAIFGSSGGVMEAALRTVVELASGQPMAKPEYQAVRGLEGIKEATVTIPANPSGPLHNEAPVDVHIAVANGLGNAKKLVKAVEDGSATYHFVEVMACPGGCIGGGGQPRSKDKEILSKRQAGLYTVDERSTVRRSHENPVVKEIYARYLGEPCGEKAHELLHTHYVECGPAKFDITAPANAQDLPEREQCEAAEICETSSSEESLSGSEQN